MFKMAASDINKSGPNSAVLKTPGKTSRPASAAGSSTAALPNKTVPGVGSGAKVVGAGGKTGVAGKGTVAR
jgi:hypothetical protein